MATKTIKIDHLYRVEGHGGIRVEVDGKNWLGLFPPANPAKIQPPAIPITYSFTLQAQWLECADS